MTDRNLIGQKIAELRKNKGMTQAELAERLGVSHQAVSQWERSETLPDILMLPEIALIFEESIGAIFGVEESTSAVKETAEEFIPVDIDKLIDEGEKKKPKASNENFSLRTDGFSLPISEKPSISAVTAITKW